MYLNTDLSEKELLKDLIMSEKLLSNSYSDTLLESYCPVLRNLLKESLSNVHDIEYSIYQAIDSRGWNRIKLVNDRELNEVVKLYNSLI